MFLGINISLVGQLRSGTAFSPASLFASGEEGVWYEPSTTTAFKSTTDLTPCGYGDSCGFLLDKSQGAGYSGGSFTGLGSELVTNGTFDDATGWTLGNGWTISGGTLSCNGNTQTATQNMGLVAGSTYFVEFEIANRTTGTLQIRTNGTSVWAGGGNGSVSITIVATAATFEFYSLSGWNGDIDNLSVRELPGNHATQVTAGARPILARVPEGGRRNQFTQTEDFTSGDWGSALNISASGNRLTATATGAASYIGQDSKTVSGANVNTWEVKYVNNPWVAVNFGGGATTAAFFDIQNGVKGTEASGYTGTITPLSGGWYRISVTGSPTVASSAFLLICDGDNDITCTVSRSVDARFPQVEAGSTATAYQKVVDQYDVTEAGVTSLEYLSFDGSDDGMATASIDFTATDEMSVFAGVEADTNSGAYIFAEISAAAATNAGSWNMYRADQGYGFNSRGSIAPTTNSVTTGYPAPSLNVVTGLGDISGDVATLRIDGTQAAQSLVDQGTGNYGNYPLNIGARDAVGTASLFFDGKIFGLIVRGAASTANEISQTEAYLANRSGVTL